MPSVLAYTVQREQGRGWDALSYNLYGEITNLPISFIADFQSVLRILSALMFVSLTNIRGKSMLFVTNCVPYL